MQVYKTMKRNKISRRSKSTEWESMKAVPKVGNVQGIDLPEAAIGSILKNFAKFTGKHLARDFFNEVFFKKRLWHRCFPVNLAKLLINLFYRTSLGDYFYLLRFGSHPSKYHTPII